MMHDIERNIIIISLINMAFFYGFTVMVFLMARKNRLNYALASQKTAWLTLILFVALPAYVERVPGMPYPYRAAVWVMLSVLSWWVMYEVYRANWHGGIRRFFRQIWCKVSGTCDMDDTQHDP